MASRDQKKDPPDDPKAGILQAIEAFEQIVEVMPDDTASLETLAHAYEQIGDREKACKYLCRLGEALLAAGDPATAGVAERLKAYAAESGDASRLAERIESATARRAEPPGEAAASEAPPAAVATDVAAQFSMDDALAYAWRLLEEKQITNEEYAKIVHDLTELSVAEANATFSILHVLEGAGHKGLDRIMNFVARDCGTPIIPLSCFDIRREAAALLPLDFAVRRGALVFDLLGRDVLAATVNPYEKGLAAEIQTLTGRRCHLFLCLPSDLDAAITKITDVQTEASPKT